MSAQGFRFNKSYDDLAQVAPYLPAFLARLEELQAAGQYRYNDSFKGRIPGIEGPDEDTAIYLLQGLQRQQEQDAKVAGMVADGYRRIEALTEIQRFDHVVLVPTRRMGGEWSEFREARIVPREGRPYGVLRKGKRTNGVLISDRDVYVGTAR